MFISLLYSVIVICDMHGWWNLVTSTMCVKFNLQEGITPFRLAVEKERSKIVKYLVEEIKVDTTLYDQVIIKYDIFAYI